MYEPVGKISVPVQTVSSIFDIERKSIYSEFKKKIIKEYNAEFSGYSHLLKAALELEVVEGVFIVNRVRPDKTTRWVTQKAASK